MDKPECILLSCPGKEGRKKASTFWIILFAWNSRTRCLLYGRKVMTNLNSILRSRDITLPPKVHLVKAMVFPVVTYGCESWAIKKAEHRRIDALELWCWGRLLRVPWTARRSNQSIVEGINPEYSLERLMLKLKLQYFGHLMQRANSLEKTLMLVNIEDRRRRGSWGWDGWTWVWANSGREWRRLVCWSLWGHKELDMTERLNWTELTRWTLVSKVISLLFNMLSRLVTAFLRRSKCLLISWPQSPSPVILESKKH